MQGQQASKQGQQAHILDDGLFAGAVLKADRVADLQHGMGAHAVDISAQQAADVRSGMPASNSVSVISIDLKISDQTHCLSSTALKIFDHSV